MIECFCCGPYQTNVWLYVEEKSKECLLVDATPGSFEILSKRLEGLKIHLFLTHGHWDHIADAGLFQSKLKAKVYMHVDDNLWLSEKLQAMIMPRGVHFINFTPDVKLKGGEQYEIAGKILEILSLPGHTQGQIAVYMKADHQIFVGDTLFKNGVGRADLPGGDVKMLRQSLNVLWKLPENTVVYSGHGPCTTLKAEKR